ncbi:MAG: histidine phosphatase family protein [Acidobacteriaceae bacterium]|nr:histidine phosphatase family protein [Acidobacteriaceae bacterium]
MIEVQTRMVREIENLRARHNEGTVAVVSHADPLRTLIAHYLGMPLDLLLRFDISPASVTVVRFVEDWPSIRCLNYTREIPI